ncbi:phospholipase A1-like [Episyrphus balteatus]|uniref:phospholipase A1-like n=1 Tax=Episyrphus balteatus TaxID=286459 RepID=UPI0024868BCC|nr:phospholipase A1-like [Episyrphus balteatus]
MKTLVIILLSITTLVFALPFKESVESPEIDDNNGWFVPQVDGSLKWMTQDEAAKAEHTLSMGRWFGKLKVKFYLYTQKNPDDPQEIFIGNETSLSESNFNSNDETRFIIHGWQNDFTSDVNVEVRSALLDVMDCNVISVDWSQKAISINYMKSKHNVPKVGEKVAEMIDFLANEGQMSLDKLRLIGHSLGAHVAGFAGKHVTSGQIHTIIGLDPAWPLYTFNGCAKRLCDSDAQYVESIHTNGGLLGFLKPIGNADFYVNGGKSQPGCGLDVGGICAHSRSFLYYAESIRDNHFTSQKCTHWKYAVKRSCKEGGSSKFMAKLGSYLNFKFVEGSYFTPVNKESPYGTGK